MIERLLYLNLCLGWPRGFSILVWIWDDWEAFLSQSVSRVTKRLLLSQSEIWDDWEASLPQSVFGVTKRLLYLSLNLGWLRGFCISICVWGDQEASLSWSESGMIERLLYLNLNLRRLKGFSISIRIWGDWEASLSQSKSGAIGKLLYFPIFDLEWLRTLFTQSMFWSLKFSCHNWENLY